jgi:hypothetical protein
MAENVTMFLDVTPYTLEEFTNVSRSLLLSSSGPKSKLTLLASFTLRSRRCRQYIPAKRQ